MGAMRFRSTSIVGVVCLSCRVFAQQEPDPTRSTIDLVNDLRDDSIRWNADNAMTALHERGLEAVPFLELALASSDWQQRQLAAQILIGIEAYVPSDRQLQVCIEGLQQDLLPWGEPFDLGNMFVFNASAGAKWLYRHADRARPYLLLALFSEDEQQKFLSACVLGWNGEIESRNLIAAVLIPHLRNNKIDQDAVMASSALYRMGQGVIPNLRGALATADDQSRMILEDLLRDLGDPPQSEAEMAARARPREQRGESIFWLPHVQFDPGDFQIVWGTRINSKSD